MHLFTSAQASRYGRRALLLLALALFTGAAWQSRALPDGPGKAEAQKLCAGCHELDKSFSLKQDRAGWQRTVDKMVAFGLKASDAEIELVLEYLVKNYPADEAPKLHVNTAPALEFESILSLKRSQAAAVIKYREEHGAFKNLEDLKKVPGLDAAKLEAQKDRLVFE